MPGPHIEYVRLGKHDLISSQMFSRRILVRSIAIVGTLLCVLTPGIVTANNTNPHLIGGPRHPLPPPRNESSFSAPFGAHLTYYGGRVVTNFEVVVVLWGPGTTCPT